MRTTSALTVGVSVVLGVVSAAVTTLLMAEPAAPAAVSSSTPQKRPRVEVVHKIEHSESRVEDPGGPPVAPDGEPIEPDPEPEWPPPTREEAEARQLKFLAERTAEYEAEPVDYEWAPTAEVDFTRELAPAADDDFELISVDCKTTLCSATAEWPSFAAARDGFASVLHRPFSQPCSVSTLLDAPDTGGRYQVRFFLDCAEEEDG